jgi:hypothetical protein
MLAWDRRSTKSCALFPIRASYLSWRIIFQLWSFYVLRWYENDHCRAWCQNEGGREAWARRVQIMLFMVQNFLSPFLFWDVWGKENLMVNPLSSQNLWKGALSHSFTLSHWKYLISLLNCVLTWVGNRRKWNALEVDLQGEKTIKNLYQEIKDNKDVYLNLE